jgi:hypothetical protein
MSSPMGNGPRTMDPPVTGLPEIGIPVVWLATSRACSEWTTSAIAPAREPMLTTRIGNRNS